VAPLRSTKRTVAIGPETDRPTWSWVGFNLARELARYYDIRPVRSGERVSADVHLRIKDPPEGLTRADWRRSKIIYLPHDYYENLSSLVADPRLDRYHAIVAHSDYLAAQIRRFHPASRVVVAPHDDKFVLPSPNSYRARGFALWIGFSRHVVHLAAWLAEHRLPLQLVVLTDHPGKVRLPRGVRQECWTPRRQRELMSEAKVALDIKGQDFNQITRPLEKLETFMASGIPSASNDSSIITDHFRSLGFQIATADDPARWLSAEYHRETIAFARRLRARMNLGTIGEQFRDLIESIA
jgi:hypothetical protein